MKVLYGIQGTGNGHISRAGAIIPKLREYVQVDTLISGHAAEIPVSDSRTRRCSGLGFSFGKRGGIDYFDSLIKSRPIRFLNEIRELDLDSYDLVITDFEPVTAWAARRKGIPCIGLSHQSSFLCDDVPRPAVRQVLGEMVFRHYAPVDNAIGFHYQAYHENIMTPIVRQEVRNLVCSEEGHITVYLPAWGHLHISRLLKNLDMEVHLFSKHAAESFRKGNIWVRPVSGPDYLESLAGCDALVCGAGFEAPSEALFLGKRMLCIPMRGQYEQHCNAAALSEMGVSIAENADRTLSRRISALLEMPAPEPVPYPDLLPEIAENVLNMASWLMPPAKTA